MSDFDKGNCVERTILMGNLHTKPWRQHVAIYCLKDEQVNIKSHRAHTCAIAITAFKVKLIRLH